jgi:hypothetical protein
MKLFLSHAYLNKGLAEQFLLLVQDGLGFAPSDTFFSSREGDIPNGSFFVERILTNLSEANAIVSLVSQAYNSSKFCLAELGAGLTLQMKGNAAFKSFFVPPFKYSDQDAALLGVQSGTVNEATSLNTFRTEIGKLGHSLPGEPVWETARTMFLASAEIQVGQLVASDKLSRIEILDVDLDRTDLPKIKYKNKLLVVLLNGSDAELQLGPGQWIATKDGVHPTYTVPHFRVEGPNGWEKDDWSKDEVTVVKVPPFRRTRFWIGLPDVVESIDIRRRHLRKTLGNVQLQASVNGVRTDDYVLIL